ncbi:MAG: hypothetical protein K2X81_17905 [Candidatus Obscuribacterales bacterium]|nr:hypothetical protein [Candidatus Obscuribacterales bacterium]
MRLLNPGLLLAVALSIASVHNVCWSQNGSKDLFQKSVTITNNSGNSGYVLITVVNDKTGKSKSVCTQAAFLLGAIHMQHGLPYTAEGKKRALEIALTAKDHEFHFSNDNALKNSEAGYDQQTLSQVRLELGSLSRTDLIKRFEKIEYGTAAHRFACAQVLLEHNILPWYACINSSGALYVVPDDHPKDQAEDEATPIYELHSKARADRDKTNNHQTD